MILFTELFWTRQDVLICMCSLTGELWPEISNHCLWTWARNIRCFAGQPPLFCLFLALCLPRSLATRVGWDIRVKSVLHPITLKQLDEKEFVKLWCHVDLKFSFVWLDLIYQSNWDFFLFSFFFDYLSEEQLTWASTRKRKSQWLSSRGSRRQKP